MTRWNLLKYALCAAMLCGFMLSPRLWLTARSYPHAPLWASLPGLPTPWDWLLLGLLLATLGVVVAANRPRPALLVFVTLAGLWSLWDQNRWQPWFYQYLFMFAALAFGAAPDNPERRQASLNACRLIIVGTYFWSGLQKVNWNFAHADFPWLMAPVLKTCPNRGTDPSAIAPGRRPSPSAPLAWACWCGRCARWPSPVPWACTS